MCQQRHDLEDCTAYLDKSVDDRRGFLKEKRLCFSCFGRDHMHVCCVNRRKCRKCNKYHPTTLHIDGFRREGDSPGCEESQSQPSVPSPPITPTLVQSASCTATAGDNDEVLLGIIPVNVYQKATGVAIKT